MKALYRCRLAKLGRVRFLSHLDLTRAMGRAFRRAGIDLALTEGYHPHPLLSFGPALAVGIESQAEYFDATTASMLGVETLISALNRVLPRGLSILDAARLVPPQPSLSSSLNAASYRLWFEGPPEAGERLADLARCAALPVERRDRDGGIKRVDLRPLLLEFDGSRLAEGRCDLLGVAGPAGNLRPSEFVGLIQALRITRLLRTGLYRRTSGVLLDPIHGQELNWREMSAMRE